MARTFDVTLSVRVLDEGAVIAAAARDMVRTRSRPNYREAKAFIGGRVEEALRLLLDRGLEVDGLAFEDSACEETTSAEQIEEAA